MLCGLGERGIDLPCTFEKSAVAVAVEFVFGAAGLEEAMLSFLKVERVGDYSVLQ